jgi:hypothetical protein
VLIRKSAFSIFPSARNVDELKGRVESGGLKLQFLQVEGDLNLQENSKLIVVKDEKNEKIGYMGCNIFHDFKNVFVFQTS